MADLSNQLLEVIRTRAGRGWTTWSDKEAWAALARVMGRPIPAAEFQAALESAVARGLLFKRQSGPDFRLSLPTLEAPSTAEDETLEPPPRDIVPERDLMEPLQRWLAVTYGSGEDVLIENTSKAGAPNGIWSRPDFTLARPRRFKFSSERRVLLQGYELKRADRAQVTAVHEALAHTRFVHFAYLVLHVPDFDRSFREQANEIKDHCGSHGVGFITFADPSNLTSFQIEAQPEAKTPDQSIVDDFILRCFTAENVQKLEQWMNA